ncbi:Uncharacterised protein [Vibrio cholerae]|nr:Uncharacterised protein [Vibrio cholerae]
MNINKGSQWLPLSLGVVDSRMRKLSPYLRMSFFKDGD